MFGHEFHAVELKNRIAAGWAKFVQNKAILCGKQYPLRKRLKSFHAVVTPSVMYESGCWTMTSDMTKDLRMNHRRMLRKIFGAKRLLIESSGSDGGSEDIAEGFEDALESWIDWLKRVTHDIEDINLEQNIEDWVTTH